MERGVLVLVVLGCSTPKPAPVVANHASHVALECSNDAVERLRGILLERWNAPAMLLRCTAGQFHTAGFFIEAIVDGARRTGIVDPSGAELVPFVDEPSDDPHAFIAGFRAADLDGDGEDEIIESWRRSPTHTLEPDNWLVIRMVNGNRLLRIKGPFLSRSHPELGSCSGTWQLRRGGINVSVSVSAGIPPIDCLQAGNHRFELRGRALVDAR